MKNPNVVVGLSLTAGALGLAAGGLAVADVVTAKGYEQGEGVYKLAGEDSQGYVPVEGTDIVVKDGKQYGSFYPVETAINKAYDDALNKGIGAVSAEVAMTVGLLRVRRHRRRLEDEAEAAAVQKMWDSRHEDWDK